jgi:hypothetical protein
MAVLLGLVIPNWAFADTAINEHPTTFCNPLDLDYNILEDPKKGIYREADPVALVYKDAFYIFASKSHGSPDFVHRRLVTPTNLPLDQWAPAIFESKSALYFMTTDDGKIYRSDHSKKADSWIVVGSVRGKTELDVKSLNRAPEYLFAIDAYNENGITSWAGPPLTAIQH